MGKDPFSKPDAEYDDWMSVFGQRINLTPVEFGLTEADSAEFLVAQEAFHDRQFDH